MTRDARLGEEILDVVRRYDASMLLVAPERPDPNVNEYLIQPLRSYLKNGGKRLRPMLCELGCEIVGGERSQVETTARALESLHAAALIHDDIEDESPLRRGKPSYHVIEGISCGVNAGDYGMALAFKMILDAPELDDDIRLMVLNECLEAAIRTIEGQAVDIGWARDKRLDISTDECLYVSESKSAYYTCAAPLAIGGIIGEGSKGQIDALRSIGLNMGVAFQLKDDLLNLQGEVKLTGKDAFTDILDGKRTVIIAHALANSTYDTELRDLLDAKNPNEHQVHRIIDILEETGSIGFARSVMEQKCTQAKSVLLASFEESITRDTLCALIEYVRDRMH